MVVQMMADNRIASMLSRLHLGTLGCARQVLTFHMGVVKIVRLFLSFKIIIIKIIKSLGCRPPQAMLDQYQESHSSLASATEPLTFPWCFETSS